MKKLVKLISTNEIEELRDKTLFIKELEEFFYGLKIEEITLKCTDDEKGQLTDLHITFKPNDFNHIDNLFENEPQPWLKRSKDRAKVELEKGFYNF